MFAPAYAALRPPPFHPKFWRKIALHYYLKAFPETLFQVIYMKVEATVIVSFM